jgi:superfamily II DNA helicase RecQ
MDHLSARFRGHFDRPNIKYSVRKKLDEAALLDEMAALALRDFPSQAGIVYTLSRADAEKVADGLQRRGVRCAPKCTPKVVLLVLGGSHTGRGLY